MKTKGITSIFAAAMAVFAALSALADAPTLSVSSVAFRQRYPWNGLVDIDCTAERNQTAL